MNSHLASGGLRLGVLVTALVVATALIVAASGAASGSPATVKARNSSLGRILVDAQGHTLYLFEKDKRGRSACSGLCATYWPPLLTSARPMVGQGAKASLLGTARRGDGTMQVTYAGHPLYRFLEDRQPGQTAGEGLKDFGAGWYVLTSAGKKIDKD